MKLINIGQHIGFGINLILHILYGVIKQIKYPFLIAIGFVLHLIDL